MSLTNKRLTVAFEGVDHAGKSTQVEMLRQEGLRRSKNVKTYQRPGGTILGAEIRQLIKRSPIKLDWQTEQILLAAEHNAFIRQIATSDEEWSIFDRWNPISALAYGMQAGLTSEYMLRLYSLTSTFMLDMLFIVDVPWDSVKLRTRQGEECKIEQRGGDYLKSICESYSKMVSVDGHLIYAAQFARRVIWLDATQSVNAINQEVLKKIDSFAAESVAQNIAH